MGMATDGVAALLHTLEEHIRFQVPSACDLRSGTVDMLSETEVLQETLLLTFKRLECLLEISTDLGNSFHLGDLESDTQIPKSLGTLVQLLTDMQEDLLVVLDDPTTDAAREWLSQWLSWLEVEHADILRAVLQKVESVLPEWVNTEHANEKQRHLLLLWGLHGLMKNHEHVRVGVVSALHADLSGVPRPSMSERETVKSPVQMSVTRQSYFLPGPQCCPDLQPVQAVAAADSGSSIAQGSALFYRVKAPCAWVYECPAERSSIVSRLLHGSVVHAKQLSPDSFWVEVLGSEGGFVLTDRPELDKEASLVQLSRHESLESLTRTFGLVPSNVHMTTSEAADILPAAKLTMFQQRGYVVVECAFRSWDRLRWELSGLNGKGEFSAVRQLGVRSDRTCWMGEADATEQPELCRALHLLKGLVHYLNVKLGMRLAVPQRAQVAIYGPGAAYQAHQDNKRVRVKLPDGAGELCRPVNERCVTLLLYANPQDWTLDDGGALRLYATKVDGLSSAELAKNNFTDIVPLGGRLVVFDSFYWHEVLATAEGGRDRFAVTFWANCVPDSLPLELLTE